MVHGPHPRLKNPAPCLPLHIPYMWHPRAMHPTLLVPWVTVLRVMPPGKGLGNPGKVFRAGTELRAAGGCCHCRD